MENSRIQKERSSKVNNKALTLLMKPTGPPPSNSESPKLFHTDTDRGIKFCGTADYVRTDP